MAVRIGVAAALGLLVLAGRSPHPSSQSSTAASAQPAAAATSTTIPIPANQDVATSVALPGGTHSVAFKDGAGAFACASVAITQTDGSASNVFTHSDMPAGFGMTQSAAPGAAYVKVNVHCHGGAGDSQLVVTPAP